MLNRTLLAVGFWLLAFGASAKSNVTYHSPVDYKITLAGNFGEPRPNHFHGGLDIKTDNVEGKHIYSIGDGYVSRLTVGISGFGNAVYVTHPEGYTSIYCHLQRFSPKLERMVHRTGKRDEQIDLHFSATDFPVSQGQLIALSGNTGHSTGPHLHLEIHDTRTWDMMDPLDFLAPFVNDSVAPQAHSVMVYPIEGEGREVFRANVGRIPVYSNRQVNAWGDYDHWLHNKTWYMRSYIPEGVTLPILQADSLGGVVDFSEERPYQLRYILRDFMGNESRYEFTVRGEKSAIAPQNRQRMNAGYDRLSLISLPGMQLTIPAGMMQGRMEIRPKVEQGSLSPRYTFAPRACPLFGWAELCIAIPEGVEPSRLYIDSGGHDMGGTVEGGWIVTRIRELGASYELKTKGNHE